MIRVFLGFDPREAVAYHVCCQSIIEQASEPVMFIPLARNMLKDFDGQRDGTNAFTYSRYLVPYLCDFSGWAIFLDGDMTVNTDIRELWRLQETHYNKAVAVVKHDYVTQHPRKYIGSSMESANVNYPRKNWSSVMLWNCAHYSNRTLMPDYVREAPASFLHRFHWLDDKSIGALPTDWNHLRGEYPPHSPALDHWTLGVPGIAHYADYSGSWSWHQGLLNAFKCAGEDPETMVLRAQQRMEGR